MAREDHIAVYGFNRGPRKTDYGRTGRSSRRKRFPSFFTALIFLIFFESVVRSRCGCRYRGPPAESAIRHRRDRGYRVVRVANRGGVRNGADCSFSTVRNRVLGCVNPVTYGGHSGLRARRPPAEGF